MGHTKKLKKPKCWPWNNTETMPCYVLVILDNIILSFTFAKA
jgi:hypothetical protein